MAKNWAIAIGINQYDNLPTLKYAVRDAELMAGWFQHEAKFDRVYLFTDTSPPITDANRPYKSQPSRATLRRFLRTRFDQKFLDSGDNLWFFFSGHGMRHADRDYLMPSDVDPHPDELENSAIALAYVTERLRRCGADNIVLIIDACREESRSRGLGIGEEKQQGVITITSCSPAERSYEIEELEQGSFTYSLLQGLRIHGEGNCATVERLYQYLRYRVPEINRSYQKPRQTPYAVVEPATKYHLILLPEKANLKDAETLKVDALNAEVNRNYDLAEQLWIRVLVVSPGDTDAINGIRRLAQTTTVAEPQVVRSRRNNTHSRSGVVDSPIRLPTLPSIPISISRRRLLQIAGLTGTGIGVAFVAGKGVEWISDLSNREPEPSSSSDAGNQEKTPTSPPKLELIKSEPFTFITVNTQGQKINQKKRQVDYFTEELGTNVTLDMVSIPEGKFLMGTEDEEIERLVKKYDWEGFRKEKPQHEVTVKPFYIGKYQVTQAQWKAVASLPKVKRDLEATPSYFQGEKLPVERVSWDDAEEFCARLAKKTGKEYRLPSEAEWEYACRAVTPPIFKEERSYTPFHFGETITGDLANYRASETYADESPGEYRAKTTEVGSFPPNGFGLYDMHGNVWEWCKDNWHDSYEGAPTDGSAWTTGGDDERSPLRGGAWNHYPNLCRSALRNNTFGGRDSIYNDVGFRVVWSSGRTL